MTSYSQLAPTAMVFPEQLSPTMAKSAALGPAKVGADPTTSGAGPLLVTVTSWGALAVPAGCGPKVRCVGATVAAVVGTPVPNIGTTVVGKPPAGMLSSAERPPSALGV